MVGLSVLFLSKLTFIKKMSYQHLLKGNNIKYYFPYYRLYLPKIFLKHKVQCLQLKTLLPTWSQMTNLHNDLRTFALTIAWGNEAAVPLPSFACANKRRTAAVNEKQLLIAQ